MSWVSRFDLEVLPIGSRLCEGALLRGNGLEAGQPAGVNLPRRRQLFAQSLGRGLASVGRLVDLGRAFRGQACSQPLFFRPLPVDVLFVLRLQVVLDYVREHRCPTLLVSMWWICGGALRLWRGSCGRQGALYPFSWVATISCAYYRYLFP